jgi:hypothetical protein
VKRHKGATGMWDTVEDISGIHLSHDMPCPSCGHAVHTYLACGDTCACVPAGMPGADSVRSTLISA